MHEIMHFTRKDSVTRIKRTHSRGRAVSLLLIVRYRVLAIRF